MCQVDNFVHADLHPGNILVRMEPGNPAPNKQMFRSHPHVVLLDVGMTAELSQRDRYTLLNFFKALAVRDGREAAKCTLRFSQAQGCPNPAAFIDVSCPVTIIIGTSCSSKIWSWWQSPTVLFCN
jgi:aarF domain-containing kinase